MRGLSVTHKWNRISAGRRSPGPPVENLMSWFKRGIAVRRSNKVMAEGAASLIRRLHREGRLDGILGLGGSGGTALVTESMRELPVGVPKLMVSTMASGDTRPYVGAMDVTMMYSVVDISGINQVSARILANAADAIAGMVTGQALPRSMEKPLIGASMFGVTTPAVEVGRKCLEELGYEVLVFHATGTGGQSMEALIRDGYITGVFDLTTTELADDLVGVFLGRSPSSGSSGRERHTPGGLLGSAGHGQLRSERNRPAFLSETASVRHNPTVTLMRTTPEE